MDEDEDGYFSANDDIDAFSIINPKFVIDNYNDNTFLSKIHFRDIIKYSESWTFNRTIHDDKVTELYDTLVENKGSPSIPWVLHGFYDIEKDINKIYILDGQHKIKSISKYIETFDENMTCDKYIWIWIYKIPDTINTNKVKVLDIFKKINNNRIFEDNEIPDTYITDIVNGLIKHKVFKNKIKEEKCYSPKLFSHTINKYLLENRSLFNHLSVDQVIENIIKINHKISLKSFNNLYTANNKTQFDKANTLNFYLNLSKSKYPIEKWTKFINDVEKL